MTRSELYLRIFANNIKLAVLHAIAWPLLFWVSGHPLEEWALTALVMYMAHWLSREVIVGLAMFALRRLTVRGRRALRNARIEVPNIPGDEVSPRVRLLAMFVIALLFFTVVGASLSVGVPVLSWLGLTPLAAYFVWGGWTMLAVGAVGLLFILGALGLALAIVDNASADISKGLSGVEDRVSGDPTIAGLFAYGGSATH